MSANIDKLFYKTLLKNVFSDPCHVEFWDGVTERYGDGEVAFKIIFNEPVPKADILKEPSLAFGEGYMTKKIDIEGNVQKVMESLYNNKESFLHGYSSSGILSKFKSNTLKKSKDNAQHHYDIGNEFYKLWLDESMTYSCGYFKNPEDTLEQAQRNKVDHILKKLNLKEGQTLLDIGCGWGELVIRAAKEYGVKALGITLSEEQFAKARERIEGENLKELAEVQLLDYRELGERQFDRVVSVGMLEHVGKENLNEYFSEVYKLLKQGGVSLLHSITSIKEGATNPWITKYIFPGGYIPAVKELVYHMAEKGFYLIDLESLRLHYARTLEHWARNFENALQEIKTSKDETFIRMWRLYLNSSAASFKSGNIDIHQLLFTKGVNNNLPWTREYMYD